MQHDHVLKKLFFDLLTQTPRVGVGGVDGLMRIIAIQLTKVCTAQNLKKILNCPEKYIFDFTTAGDWDCVAAVERLLALHYSVDFIFLSFGIMCCGTLRLLEGH